MEFSARQIADFLGGKIEGNEDQLVSTFSKIEEAKQGSLTFLYNPKYSEFIYTTQASIVLINDSLELKKHVAPTLVRVPNAYEALAKLLQLYDQYRPKKSGIQQPSAIHATASLGDDVYVGTFVSIGENVKIGKNVKIHPNTTIADNVSIGDDCILYSGVHIYEGTRIGKRCIIHSGAVLGADGFGFAEMTSGSYTKIPQIGIVIVEDDVEIGANTAIDRSTMGSTVIKSGTKIDNLVQIGHNVEVGEHTVLCGQVGIAGSTKVGNNVVMGGQVGVSGHIKIGDNVKIGAQSGIPASIKDNHLVMGSPAYDARDYQRAAIVSKKLPDMYKTLHALEKKVNQLLKDKE